MGSSWILGSCWTGVYLLLLLAASASGGKSPSGHLNSLLATGTDNSTESSALPDSSSHRPDDIPPFMGWVVPRRDHMFWCSSFSSECILIGGVDAQGEVITKIWRASIILNEFWGPSIQWWAPLFSKETELFEFGRSGAASAPMIDEHLLLTYVVCGGYTGEYITNECFVVSSASHLVETMNMKHILAVENTMANRTYAAMAEIRTGLNDPAYLIVGGAFGHTNPFGNFDVVYNDSIFFAPISNITELKAFGDPLPPVFGHTLVKHPTRGTYILFGGCMAELESGSSDAFEGTLDVQALSITWKKLSPAGEVTPPERCHHSAEMLPDGRMVVMGGEWSGLFGESYYYDPYCLQYDDTSGAWVWSRIQTSSFSRSHLPENVVGARLIRNQHLSWENHTSLIFFGGERVSALDGKRDSLNETHYLDLDGDKGGWLTAPSKGRDPGSRVKAGSFTHVGLVGASSCMLARDSGTKQTWALFRHDGSFFWSLLPDTTEFRHVATLLSLEKCFVEMWWLDYEVEDSPYSVPTRPSGGYLSSISPQSEQGGWVDVITNSSSPTPRFYAAATGIDDATGLVMGGSEEIIQSTSVSNSSIAEFNDIWMLNMSQRGKSVCKAAEWTEVLINGTRVCIWTLVHGDGVNGEGGFRGQRFYLLHHTDNGILQNDRPIGSDATATALRSFSGGDSDIALVVVIGGAVKSQDPKRDKWYWNTQPMSDFVKLLAVTGDGVGRWIPVRMDLESGVQERFRIVPEPRFGHAAVKFSNTSVIVHGGRVVREYNEETENWDQVVVGDKWLLQIGECEYDSTECIIQWIPLLEQPEDVQPRADHGAVILDGNFVISGGVDRYLPVTEGFPSSLTDRSCPVECPSGTELVDASRCEFCPKGTFSEGSGPCTPCGRSLSTTYSGSSSCDTCAACDHGDCVQELEDLVPVCSCHFGFFGDTCSMPVGYTLIVLCCAVFIAIPVARYFLKRRLRRGLRREQVLEASLLAMEKTQKAWEIPCKDIVLKKRIASGSSAIIHLAVWSGKKVAVKEFISDFDIATFEREVEILKTLHHPHVLLFWGAILDPRCIITEYMDGGSLWDKIKQRSLTEPQKLEVLTGVCRGMMYLHNRDPPLIHRDLKSPNILISKDITAKVADFGISSVHSAMMTSGVGTTRWMAPETLCQTASYSKASDVWGFGMILVELATGDIPYADVEWEAEVIRLVSEGKMPSEKDDMTPVERKLWELATLCCAYSPDDRPSMKEILFWLEMVWESVSKEHGQAAATKPNTATEKLATFFNRPADR